MTNAAEAAVTAQTARAVRTMSVDSLRQLMARLLVACGCSEAHALSCANVFLDADLKGIGLQGLDHMPTLIRHLRRGRTDPRAIPEVVRDDGATILIDGHRGLGQINALFAVDALVRKTREIGCAAVGVINTGDFFMAGHYAERIARNGLVGLVFSDAPPLVHVHGGTERMTGTNPLAIGIPTNGPDPIVHDMATSALSASRIRQAEYHGEEVPLGSGVTRDGRSTVNAAEIRDGAIAPLAGHKGFGLALCVALLSGPLVGAFCGPALGSWMTDQFGEGMPRGQLFLGIDPAAFGDPQVFRSKVSKYVQEIKSSRKAPGVDAIRMPGERSFAMRRQQLAEGKVALYDAVWRRTQEMATELGIEVPVE